MTYSEIAAQAKLLLPEFLTATSDIPYEAKGVLASEMLFMIAVLKGKPLGRILESGRARGQSTLLLARALPHTEIISIEFDPDSPDVEIANARLKAQKNVVLLFGDARVELPRRVEKNDAVIIDGPKMFRAVRLALALLATKKVTHVFLHDVTKKTPERHFLDRFIQESRFSDNREVSQVTHVADGDAAHIPDNQKLDGFEGEFGYGFSLACIPYVPGRSYTYLMMMALIYDVCSRIGRKCSNLGASLLQKHK